MKCTKCRLHERSGVNMLMGNGNPKADIMFVGEAPGAEEEQKGAPFVGDAGKVYNEALRKAGFSRQEVWTDNIVRCRPPGNRTPGKKEIAACKPYLESVIRRVNPQLIVLMGNPALSLIDMEKVTARRGHVYTDPRYPNTYFLGSYHPSAGLRSWEVLEMFERDIKKAQRILGDEKTLERMADPLVPDFDVEVVLDVDLALDILESLKDDKLLFTDLEATGLDFWEDDVLCAGFCGDDLTAYVIPILGQECRQLRDPDEQTRLISGMGEFLEERDNLGAHNETFETQMYKGSLGIDVAGRFTVDTMCLHHLICEYLPHGLTFLSEWYYDAPDYEYYARNLLPSKNASYDKMPEQNLWRYCGCDCIYERMLGDTLLEEAAREGVIPVYKKVTGKLLPVLSRMEWYGNRLNMEFIERRREEVKETLEEEEQELFEIIGKDSEDYNLNYYVDKGKILYEILGLPVVEKTPTGAPSTKKEVIAQLLDDYSCENDRVAERVLEILKNRASLQHGLSTFFGEDSTFVGVAKDGVVHPSWKAHGTRTGRLSVSNPPAHNIDKDGDTRCIFYAEPGRVYISADYSQVELRVLAFRSGDPALCRAYAEGRDIHKFVAAEIQGVPEEQVTAKQRQDAKSVNFGIVYGRGPHSLAEQLGTTVEGAQDYLDAYFDRFRGAKAFIEKQQKFIDVNGYIQTPIGRKRRFSGIWTFAEQVAKSIELSDSSRGRWWYQRQEIYRQGVNMTVQSPASDVLSQATIRIDRRIDWETVFIVHSHHDALSLTCPEEGAYKTVEMMVEEMERPVSELGNTSFPVELEVGRYWGDKSLTAGVLAGTELERVADLE